jgi:UV DNA damage endonuclease
MNLGYACINMTLGKQKPKVTTNRSMIKKTFLEKGVEYAGELGLQNARDLFKILEWLLRQRTWYSYYLSSWSF